MQKVILVGLLLLGGIGNADAREPWAIVGIGTMECRLYVSASKDKNAKAITDPAFAWVQGWFSAKNMGDGAAKPRTVGGSLSANTLEGFFVSECEDHPENKLFVAANDLYARLAEKGL